MGALGPSLPRSARSATGGRSAASDGREVAPAILERRTLPGEARQQIEPELEGC
jgi:hypothetical protein